MHQITANGVQEKELLKSKHKFLKQWGTQVSNMYSFFFFWQQSSPVHSRCTELTMKPSLGRLSLLLFSLLFSYSYRLALNLLGLQTGPSLINIFIQHVFINHLSRAMYRPVICHLGYSISCHRSDSRTTVMFPALFLFLYSPVTIKITIANTVWHWPCARHSSKCFI